jgi:predicted metal-binding protein
LKALFETPDICLTIGVKHGNPPILPTFSYFQKLMKFYRFQTLYLRIISGDKSDKIENEKEYDRGNSVARQFFGHFSLFWII